MRGGRAKAVRQAGASLALLACALGTVAEAQTAAVKRCYEAEFFLEPIAIPAQPVWIPEGDPIFETRLLPRELWTVTAPVMAAGKAVLKPGDQLMSMRSVMPTRCTFPQLGADAPGPRERICVFDPDLDGTFDKVFVRDRGGEGWFARVWEHPVAPLTEIAPVAMTKSDPAQFVGGPRLRYYSDHTPLRRKPRDGSPPYYEAFTRAHISVPNGIEWYLEIDNAYKQYSYSGLLKGSVVEFEGLWMRVVEVAKEKVMIDYKGNFAGGVIDLPFEVPLEKKCDIGTPKMR